MFRAPSSPSGVLIAVVTLGSPLLALALASQDVSARTRFESRATILVTGKIPVSVERGDLDGDGRPDLVAAEARDGTVSVWLNQGQRRFAKGASYATGSFPTSLALGDCDGDGWLDLAVAHNGDATLRVLSGNGDGTFDAPITVGAFPQVRKIALHDLNADGNLDLVAVGDADSLVVFGGSGTGTFPARTSYVVNDNPYAIDFGDVDTNGQVDIAVAHIGSSLVSMLFGQGGGAFAPRVDLDVGGIQFAVSVADLDGDSKLDLLVSRSSGVAWRAGNGSGGFGGIVALPIPPANNLFVADLDGDGHQDVITEKNTLLRHGDGSTKIVHHAIGRDPVDGAAGDLDGDGKLDLAFGHSPNAHLWLHFGNGDGTFGTDSEYPAAFSPGALALGDLNRDGWLDVVTVSDYDVGNSTFSVSLGVGGGALGPKTDYPIPYYPMDAALGDVNGDEVLDVALVRRSPHALIVRLGLGNGTFGPDTVYPSIVEPLSVEIADLDHDGLQDFVVGGTASSSGQVSVHRGGAFGGYITHTEYPGGPYVTLGDWNSDGHLDFVGPYISIGLNVGLGIGNGAFSSQVGPPVRGYSMVAADLNLDGALDLAGGIPNAALDYFDEDSVAIFQGHGDGTFELQATLPVGMEPQFGASGDLDRDGDFDLVFANRSSNSITVLYNTPAGIGTDVEHLATAGTPHTIAVGDMDADGWPDLVVTTSFNSSVSVMRNLGATVVDAPRDLRGGLRMVAGPNPAQRDVRFAITLPRTGHVSLRIYDVMGRVVRELWTGPLDAGARVMAWDRRTTQGHRVPAGVYLAELAMGAERATGRIVVLP